MSSVTGTEGRIFYVTVLDAFTYGNYRSALRSLSAALDEAGVVTSRDVELWTRDDGFMVCVPVEGDTRHFKHEGWRRRV